MQQRRLARDMLAAGVQHERSSGDQLTELGDWSTEDAERWWKERGLAVSSAVRAGRGVGSTPGPRTVAVDLERRAPSARPGAPSE